MTPEDEKVIVRDGRIVAASKELDPRECAGEFIGLAQFGRRAARRLFTEMENVVKAGNLMAFLTVAFEQLAAHGTAARPLPDREAALGRQRRPRRPRPLAREGLPRHPRAAEDARRRRADDRRSLADRRSRRPPRAARGARRARSSARARSRGSISTGTRSSTSRRSRTARSRRSRASWTRPRRRRSSKDGRLPDGSPWTIPINLQVAGGRPPSGCAAPARRCSGTPRRAGPRERSRSPRSSGSTSSPTPRACTGRRAASTPAWTAS